MWTRRDPGAAEEILGLLSKENMRENRIQELWQGYFVDRQVHQVLTELFTGTEPPRDLVALVAKRIDRLPKPAVRESLVRARATFDFPVPVPHAPLSVVPADPVDRPRPEASPAEPQVRRAGEPPPLVVRRRR